MWRILPAGKSGTCNVRLRLVPPPLPTSLFFAPSPRFFSSDSMARMVPSASSTSIAAAVSEGSSISSIGSSFSLSSRRSGEMFSPEIFILAFRSSSDAFAMSLSLCKRNTRSVASGSEASNISSEIDSLDMRSSSAASSSPTPYCVCDATPPICEEDFVPISNSCCCCFLCPSFEEDAATLGFILC